VLLQPTAEANRERKARLLLVEQTGLGGVVGSASDGGGVGTQAVLRECAKRARARVIVIQELLES
jgi:hypothetical protein